jgi:hypothetical protein
VLPLSNKAQTLFSKSVFIWLSNWLNRNKPSTRPLYQIQCDTKQKC